MERATRIARMLVSSESLSGAYGWDRNHWFKVQLRDKNRPAISGYIDTQRVSIDQSPYHPYMKQAILGLTKQFPEVTSHKIDFDGWIPGSVTDYLGDRSLDRPEGGLPKFMYHGTSYNKWKLIQKEGLKPRSKTNILPAYGASMEHASPADPNQVYLAATFGNAVKFASRDASNSDGSKRVVLQIDSSGLNYQKLRPDVDSRSNSWEKSLHEIGAVGYEGSIAPEQINIYKIFDISVAKWVDE